MTEKMDQNRNIMNNMDSFYNQSNQQGGIQIPQMIDMNQLNLNNQMPMNNNLNNPQNPMNNPNLFSNMNQDIQLDPQYNNNNLNVVPGTGINHNQNQGINPKINETDDGLSGLNIPKHEIDENKKDDDEDDFEARLRNLKK